MWVTMHAMPLAEYLIEMALENDTVEFYSEAGCFDTSEMAERVTSANYTARGDVVTIDGEVTIAPPSDDGDGAPTETMWHLVFAPREGDVTLVIG